MIAALRRADLGPVEIGLLVFVGGGLLVQVLRPSRVAQVVALSSGAAAHPGLVVSGVVVGVAASVFAISSRWGPVRVDPADLRWRLAGPADRSTVLRRRAVTVLGVALAAGAAVGGLTATLVPELAVVAVGGAAAGAAPGYVLAYLRQRRRDRRHGTTPPRASSLSPGNLHRKTFAPRDGYSGALGLALTMLDVSWLEEARVTRWQRARVRAGGRSLPGGAASALMRVDLRRLLRHPDALVRWSVSVAAGVGAAVLLDFRHAETVVAVLAVYCAGCSVSGGLRVSVRSAALRRATGLSDRFVYGCHALIPVLGTLAAAAVVLPWWSLSPVAAVILAAGTAVAVLRRGLRPELRYDGPVTADPMTGSAVNLQLFFAQIRGLGALAVTLLVAGAF
ncbi:MAG: DUF6297 family protein [Gordonia sp. (in: high G+C Gram-positive bacteria)]|uniref:DUF6297 family protein n=1 Tax=Gordonia sp. (in: high G+C Gram-positive bacteria) TaxID=84139 RepID=UPI0039E27D8B